MCLFSPRVRLRVIDKLIDTMKGKSDIKVENDYLSLIRPIRTPHKYKAANDPKLNVSKKCGTCAYGFCKFWNFTGCGIELVEEASYPVHRTTRMAQQAHGMDVDRLASVHGANTNT